MNNEFGVWLDYLIRFQNIGTATALTARIDDFIEDQLDLTSFQLLGMSHYGEVRFKEGRLIVFFFDQIMLNSSTDLEASQGYVSFRMRTISGLHLEDEIDNLVSIYFDFNEPIITNTASTVFYDCPPMTTILHSKLIF